MQGCFFFFITFSQNMSGWKINYLSVIVFFSFIQAYDNSFIIIEVIQLGITSNVLH